VLEFVPGAAAAPQGDCVDPTTGEDLCS